MEKSKEEMEAADALLVLASATLNDTSSGGIMGVSAVQPHEDHRFIRPWEEQETPSDNGNSENVSDGGILGANDLPISFVKRQEDRVSILPSVSEFVFLIPPLPPASTSGSSNSAASTSASAASSSSTTVIRSRPAMIRATPFVQVAKCQIPRQSWAKARMQHDICKAAGVLFDALFSNEEIERSSIGGRSGTSFLDLDKQAAIYLAVGWMKHKDKFPYIFDANLLKEADFLSEQEQLMIRTKVFVERRSQVIRKARRRNNAEAGLEMQNQIPTPESEMAKTETTDAVPLIQEEND